MIHDLIIENRSIYYILVVITGCFLSALAIPSIIFVATERHLYDDLEKDRKDHIHNISNLGGIAIFCSFTIVSLLFADFNAVLPTNYLLTACIILFAVGLKDDIIGVNSSTRFIIQFLVASILVFLADVKLTSLYGVFNITDLNPVFSYIFSIVIIILMINAFNLIDGIDGLAGTIGLITNVTLGTLFIHMQQFELACVAYSLAGAILGFLFYNYTPSRIFMGDTGSLLIGMISIVLAIKFIELNKFLPTNKDPFFYSAPAVAVATLIIPIFDTIRVFLIRILKGKSPFSADRNHIHHRLLKLGLTHLQATFLLGFSNLIFIYLALEFRDLGNFILISILVLICMFLNWTTTFLIRSKERKSLRMINILR